MNTHNYEPTRYVNYEQTTPNPYLDVTYLPPPPPPEYYMHQRTGGEAAGGQRAGSVNVSVEERAAPPTSLPDSFGATMHRACREAWHPQGPHRSTLPPRATTYRGTATPPGDGPTGVRAGMDNM